MKTLAVLLLAGMVLAVLVLGGGDWLKAEADRAAAQRIQAEAARARAEYDGRATLALAEAQSDALRANAALPVLIVVTSVAAVASVMVLAIVAIRTRSAAGAAPASVVHVYQVSEPGQRSCRIETALGVMELPPERGETRAAYLLRVGEIAARVGGGRLLPPRE